MKLHIDKAIYGGAGLGRVSDEGNALCGKTVFVPFALPGETVELHITEDKRSYATGELDAVLEAAEMRTTPACPYFGGCGGCHYQHAEYAGQLEMKRAILRETLERARLKNLPEIAVVANEPWAYRNRIRLLVQARPEFALCNRRRSSHASLAISTCPIAAPLLQRAVAAITKVGAASGLAALCQEIEFFTNAAEDSLLIAMHSLQSPRNTATLLEQACALFARELPELKGAALFAHGDEENHGQVLARWGEQTLLYRAAGFDYRVSLGSFFQVNRFLVDPLAALVVEGRSGKLAWDLYAGVGLFARALSANFESVVAVEAAPFSAADLRHNMQGTSHNMLRRATRDFLRDQTRSKSSRPDLVVVDPPRSGLGDEVSSLLVKAAPSEIVYVSCDPATLSRDLNTLLQSGYHLRQIHMVDLFPQTFHMESVVVLSHN
jgi:23S rRNA (uracil1939-C5)-methyltransferase